MNQFRGFDFSSVVRSELASKQVTKIRVAEATGIPYRRFLDLVNGAGNFCMDEAFMVARYLEVDLHELVARAEATRERG